jgi:FkbM family methyltransferase
MGLNRFVRTIARRGLKLDVVRLDAFPFMPHLRRHNISLVLDVGANEGQYAKLLRTNHYTGRIVSFEPAREPFARLLDASKSDQEWSVEQCALGGSSGVADLNISSGSVMNSFLPLNAQAQSDLPWAASTTTERVHLKRLDDVFPDHARAGKAVLLKVDVQGFEAEVLRGAEHSLPKIVLVQLEGAVEPLYVGEPTFLEHIAAMTGRGFRLVDLHEVFRDEQGRLVHLDCLFERG